MRKIISILFPSLILIGGALIFTIQTSATVQTAEIAASPSISGRAVYTGLAAPLDLDTTGLPGDNRIFITGQDGAIRINGVNFETPFLNITDEVGTENEKGMLGMAFDPDFANNKYFYVFYTGLSDNMGAFTSYVERFTVSNDPNFADKSSRVKILQFNQREPYHNGGNLAFGPDGYLYIGIGDDNHPEEAQDLNLFTGKILRIDVDPTTVGNQPADCDAIAGNYSVPADNPFVGQAACEEIWAYGLRNPWRFSFDSATGDLYIGDVGESRTEELDFQPASSIGGENYGWPLFEGLSCADNQLQADCDNLANHTPPIHEFAHDEGAVSITGGFVYRGSQFPNMVGHYVFADYLGARVWSTINNNGTWELTSHGGLYEGSPALLSSFGVDAREELFALRFDSGSMYQIIDEYGFDIQMEAPSTIDSGVNIEYTIAITNTGSMTATDVVVESDVPAQTNYVSGGSLSGNKVSWTIPSLAPTESMTVSWMTFPLTSTIMSPEYRVSANSGPVISGTQVVTSVVSSGINGRIFEDVDRNGIDDGEPGILGAEVVLWEDDNCDGVIVTTPTPDSDYVTAVTSAADGSYSFDIPNDSYCYFVQVQLSTLPNNLSKITLWNEGDDDALDSDIDPTNGWTNFFSVPVPAVNGGFYDPNTTIEQLIYLPMIVR